MKNKALYLLVLFSATAFSLNSWSATCSKLLRTNKFKVLSVQDAVYYRHSLTMFIESSLSHKELRLIAPARLRYSRKPIQNLIAHISQLPESFKAELIQRAVDQAHSSIPKELESSRRPPINYIAHTKLDAEGIQKFAEASLEDSLLNIAVNRGRFDLIRTAVKASNKNLNYLIGITIGHLIGTDIGLKSTFTNTEHLASLAESWIVILGAIQTVNMLLNPISKPLKLEPSDKALGERVYLIYAGLESLHPFISDYSDYSDK